ELLWLGILLLFNITLFQQTNQIAEWDQNQYLFFIGCYFALGGLLETVFLDNCNEFAELVRTGDLDFFLLQPIDEQFLISCRKIDCSCAPNVVLGAGVMVYGLVRLHWQGPWYHVPTFLVMFGSGVGMAYGFLLLRTAASVGFTCNQGLLEMWWL